MAVFSRYVNNCSKLDWEVLVNGSISMYYDNDIMIQDLEWLRKNAYKIIELDFGFIDTPENFHKQIKKICEFPKYYGENSSALKDCLIHDLEIPYESGCAIVLKKYNQFYEKNKETAHEILESISESSRIRILMGERLITLLQSDSPTFLPDTIGARRILWNMQEAIDSIRIQKR